MIDQIETYLSLDSDKLFLTIADSLASGASTEAPSSDAGRAWFEKNKVRFKKAVCGTNVVKVYLESEKANNRVLLVAAIADMVAGACGAIPPVTVAVLLVKEGLDSLCS